MKTTALVCMIIFLGLMFYSAFIDINIAAEIMFGVLAILFGTASLVIKLIEIITDRSF